MKVRQNLLGLTIADDMAWACVMWHFGGNWIMQLSVDADRDDAEIMWRAQAARYDNPQDPWKLWIHGQRGVVAGVQLGHWPYHTRVGWRPPQ
jgi:hypothetical protein